MATMFSNFGDVITVSTEVGEFKLEIMLMTQEYMIGKVVECLTYIEVEGEELKLGQQITIKNPNNERDNRIEIDTE